MTGRGDPVNLLAGLVVATASGFVVGVAITVRDCATVLQLYCTTVLLCYRHSSTVAQHSSTVATVTAGSDRAACTVPRRAGGDGRSILIRLLCMPIGSPARALHTHILKILL
jgi:hypothetical protein